VLVGSAGNLAREARQTGHDRACARCGLPIERHLVDPLPCVDDQPHDFGDWKKAAMPLNRFREFPGTFAGIVGIVAMIPTYDRPIHAAIVALSCAAITYIVMLL
jgi:hypothetical protein